MIIKGRLFHVPHKTTVVRSLTAIIGDLQVWGPNGPLVHSLFPSLE